MGKESMLPRKDTVTGLAPGADSRSSSRGAQQLLGEATWTQLPWQPVSLVTGGRRSRRSNSIKDEPMLGGVCREVMLGSRERPSGETRGRCSVPKQELNPTARDVGFSLAWQGLQRASCLQRQEWDHRHLRSGPNPKELGEKMEGRDLKKKKKKGLGIVMELISTVAWKQKRKTNVI